MKTHWYFETVTPKKHPEAHRNRAWCQRAIENPIRKTVQSDGKIQHWIWLPHEKRYLRVVTLEDGETIFNAHYDRRFKP